MFLLIFFIDSLYGLWLTLLINKTFEKNVKHSFNKQQQNISRDSNKDEGFQL